VEIRVEGKKESQVIKVIGEMVSENCENLKETALSIASKKPEEVVLDLAEVPFIDTSGLGVLVGLRSRLKEKKIDFRVVNPSERVLNSLYLTRLDTVFGIKD